MNIETAKIAIDKMVSFLPECLLNDLYKDHSATAHIISKDDNKIVFSVIFNDGEKRILTITVKKNEINAHYNGTMQVFSHRIDESFFNDVVNVLFPEAKAEGEQFYLKPKEKTTMSNFTLNTVIDSIKSDVQDVLSRLTQIEINELTASDVCDLLDENAYYAPEVIYYADAWEVVAGNSFNDYEANCLDFSVCDNALDCIMQEANALVNDAYYSEREAIASEVLEDLQNELED